MSSLFITCLWGGEDTGGGPTGPPPLIEGTDPLWLWSPVMSINNVFSKYTMPREPIISLPSTDIFFLVLEEDGVTMFSTEEGGDIIVLEESP